MNANTIELKMNSKNKGAKVALAVTLFAFLAACSHKAVEDDAANMAPLPANEEVASLPAADADTTPIPDAEAPAVADTPAPIAAPVRASHAKKHHVAKSRLKKAHRKHKVARHHKAKKQIKKTAALGQVSKNSPTPPAPPVVPPPPTLEMSAPTATSALDPNTNAMRLGQDEPTPSNRAWMIWTLVIVGALGGLVGYRQRQQRRSTSERLVFTA